jgi:molybdopterin/thiamine biosynthesis adenylyltransferase
MSERSARQSFLGDSSDDVLRRLHVAVVGLGGGGSHVVQQLAHVGVGHYTRVDHDRIDRSNLNRLVGGTEADVRRNAHKTMIGARQIRRVLPTAKISQVRDRWQSAASALHACDVVVGCLDTFDGRLQLEALTRRYLIPYIDLGMDVYEMDGGFGIAGQIALSMPGRPCLKCMNVIHEEWRAKEAANYGAAGGRPQVVWPNGVLASLAVGVIVQLATPWNNRHQEALLLEYDGNAHVVQRSTMLRDLTGCPHFESIDNIGDPWFRCPA